MITRQRKTLSPCVRCGLHPDRCICAEIASLTLRTRLTLIIHHRETKRTTNTGALAVHALTNSEMLVRGLPEGPLDLAGVIRPGYEPYVLYPSDDAVDLETIRPAKPVQLIVADGNWRQASKVHKRHAELRDLPRVKISQRNLASHHLRKEHFDNGFSTLEAIALAIGILEGEEAGQALLGVYHAKLRATLAGRAR